MGKKTTMKMGHNIPTVNFNITDEEKGNIHNLTDVLSERGLSYDMVAVNGDLGERFIMTIRNTEGNPVKVFQSYRISALLEQVRPFLSRFLGSLSSVREDKYTGMVVRRSRYGESRRLWSKTPVWQVTSGKNVGK